MSDSAQDLVVVGFGGFGREIVDLVCSGTTTGSWRLVGVLDDDERMHGRAAGPISVTGPSSRVADIDGAVVVSVGNPRDLEVRRRVVERLALDHGRYATIVAESAHLGMGCTIGAGCVVMPGVVCTTDVRVGMHVSIMPNCTLAHDVSVGDFVAVGSGTQLAGGVSVGRGAYLGAGALVREGVRVGDGALVGMGSVVLGDVPEGEVWAGAPARRLR